MPEHATLTSGEFGELTQQIQAVVTETVGPMVAGQVGAEIKKHNEAERSSADHRRYEDKRDRKRFWSRLLLVMVPIIGSGGAYSANYVASIPAQVEKNTKGLRKVQKIQAREIIVGSERHDQVLNEIRALKTGQVPEQEPPEVTEARKQANTIKRKAKRKQLIEQLHGEDLADEIIDDLEADDIVAELESNGNK